MIIYNTTPNRILRNIVKVTHKFNFLLILLKVHLRYNKFGTENYY